MAGQIVHFEIPADNTEQSREFWGGLFGWQFQAFPGPSEYHMTQIGEQTGGAITNMEPDKRGTRAYFSVDEIGAGAERVRELGAKPATRCPSPRWAGFRPAPTRTATSSACGRPTPRPACPRSEQWCLAPLFTLRPCQAGSVLAVACASTSSGVRFSSSWTPRFNPTMATTAATAMIPAIPMSTDRVA